MYSNRWTYTLHCIIIDEIEMQKRAKILVALAAVALTLSAVFIGNYMLSSQGAQPEPTPTKTPTPLTDVVFTCKATNGEPFNITFPLDLNAGMDSTQAIQLSKNIFAHEFENATSILDSVSLSEEGTWLVSLSWGSIVNGHQEDYSHYFDVEVDPTNHTATYY